MFADHFRMTEQPFCEYLNVNRIQQDERFAQAMARLNYFVIQGALAMITGTTGVGKSTLIKLFLSSLARNRYLGVYIHITQVRSSSLLKLIATQLGQTPRLSKERVFGQILSKTRSSELDHILIIDEAHLISAEALTDLRLLVSCAMDETPPLRIVLVGQEQLKNTLSQPGLADLFHRINVRYELKPLDRLQTIRYLDAHLRNAGAKTTVFSNEVKDLIFELSHGIPRQINQVATACLLNAAAKGLQVVDEALFSETMNEFLIQ